MISQVPQAREYVYTPPNLPAHLSSLHDLKPIAGQPTDEEVKSIHAVIRAVDAGARIPGLYGPDLPQELSQHLFSVQMAVYRNRYPMNIFPGENTYTPPSMPTYIPIQLEPVVGTPSKEQLKVAQNAMKTVESLGSGPLFDPDLNMELSQHLFNLQFARYIQDSSLGQFVPRPTESQHVPSDIQGQENPCPPQAEPNNGGQPKATWLDDRNIEADPTPSQSPEITSQAETMKDVKELLSKSNGVLENINRVLIAIQNNSSVVGDSSTRNNLMIHLNPVNEKGMTATECGLPRLRISFGVFGYTLLLNAAQAAGYLKFLGIGGDLIEGGEIPKLIDGNNGYQAAKTLILKHYGLVY